MSKFLSSKQMREIEAAAIGSCSVTGLELMERAGRGVVNATQAHWPELKTPAKAIVLSGPGNNGGDGFVIARLLHELRWQSTVYFYGAANRLPADARVNFERWVGMPDTKTEYLSFPSVTDQEASQFASDAYEGPGAVLIVDALFGIGLTRPLTGLRPIIELNERHSLPEPGRSGTYHVSVDVPSGLAEDGPIALGPAEVFHADLTVTFHSLKEAHRHGAKFCGKTVVVDIGLPSATT